MISYPSPFQFSPKHESAEPSPPAWASKHLQISPKTVSLGRNPSEDRLQTSGLEGRAPLFPNMIFGHQQAVHKTILGRTRSNFFFFFK